MRRRIAFNAQAYHQKATRGRVRALKASRNRWYRSPEMLYDFTQPVVRERFYAMIIAAGHGMVVDQRIHDCFFGRLHHSREERVH